jgi:hypothetical protein
MLGTIKNGLLSSGTFYWTIPVPYVVSNTTCTGNTIECLAAISQAPATDCTPFCTLENGLYKLQAQLFQGSREIARAESRTFSLGGSALSSTELSGIGSSWTLSPNYSSTSSYSQYLLTLTDPAQTSTTTPNMCVYSGVPYQDGIAVQISCADVVSAGQTCGTYSGIQLTCRNGIWRDQAGQEQTIRNVTNTLTPGSCITPWSATVVASGNSIPREPFFTNGVYASAGAPLLMKCASGVWQTCDTIGYNCQ